MESLISSSSFDVIQDDSLRNLLVTWKDVYNDYKEEEQYARDLQNLELVPYLAKTPVLLIRMMKLILMN